MKDPEKTNLFNTGICENTWSKQTIVSIILKLKASIDKPVTVIKGNVLEEYFFNDVYNESGCIVLTGPKISGTSLLTYFKNIKSTKFSPDSIKGFFSLIIKIIDSLNTYIQYKKSYPLLLLSSIFYDEKADSITILPNGIAKILGSYLPQEDQTLNNFSIPDPLKDSIDTEQELAKSLVYLIYLFFLVISNSKIQRSIIYDVRTLVKGVPDYIANLIWNVLKKKTNTTLNNIKELLKRFTSLDLDKPSHVPIFRKMGVVNFLYKISYTIVYKWKLILVIAVVAGIFLYTISDLIYKSKLSDITKGKTPNEVVEMYIKAIKDLDIETLDSLLYKRAGKDIIKEVSSVYVVKRMTEIYGLRWMSPAEVDINDLPENVKVYGIENVTIKKISNSKEPTFLIYYTKIFGEKGSLGIYNYQEKLKLKNIKNRWFIFSVTRKLINKKEIK